MALKKKEEVDCATECAALKKDVATLKKEIAALKKELKAKPSGGADPRVEKLISFLKDHNPKWKIKLDNLGV